MFYLENEGQSHGVHLQWSHSMANINVYKSHRPTRAFFVSSNRLRDIYILTFVTWKMLVKVMKYNIRIGAIRWMQILDFLCDGNSNVCIFQRLLVKIATWKVWLWKFRSRSQIKIFAMTPFDGKCQDLQTSFFTFYIFIKVRPVRTKVIYTHTEPRTETYMSIAIGEILQICLKM